MFVIIFVLILMLLVISHELGHFLTAKRFGIKVLEFGFGIPPKLWSKKIGETIYSINLLPVGGFVRLHGEDETDKKILKDPKSFAYKGVWERIAVVLAGVFMNLVLAWVMFYGVLIAQDFKIIYPTPEPSVVVADLEDNYPAKLAGLKAGDRLVKIDGVEVKSIDEAVQYIRARPEVTVNLTVADLEGDNPKEVKLTPRKEADGQGKVGIAFSPVPFKEYKGFSNRLFSGITYSSDLTRLTFMGLGTLFTDVSKGDLNKASQNVAGPIGLVKVSQSISSLGLQAILPYMWFIGVISLTLAVFNSLPFPALDGGRAVFLFYEALTKKKPNPEFEKAVHNIGMAILLMMIALITFSDIRKLF